MEYWRKSVLFYLGGCAYMGLELLWRGWTHGTMFLAGGTAFLLLGQLQRRRLPLYFSLPLGAGVITAVELTAGLLFNRQHRIWDYSREVLNWRGQICLPFSILWLFLCLPAFRLYGLLEKKIPG